MSLQKTTKKTKDTAFSNKRKLEFAKDITRLRRYEADEIAEFLGTSRQNINYHMKKEANNRGK